MILENMDSKFELVLEGQESLRKEMHGICEELSEKIDMNTFKIDVQNQKIGDVQTELKEEIRAVDANLSAHRHDTEAHRRGDQVRED